MNKLILAVLTFLLFFVIACGKKASTESLNIRYYGNFKNIVQQRNTDGVVDLNAVLTAPNTYAVGAIKKGEGEITVQNSEVWLSYGKDGLNKTTRTIPKKEQALLLVTAQVENWQEIVVQKSMSQSELNEFIVENAKKHGIDTNLPFPFLIEGNFQKILWHISNGLNPKFKGHGQGTLFTQLTEEKKQTDATIIGFYSAKIQGVFTHPGDSWHLHVLFRNEKKAGHVDEITVQKGNILKLPMSVGISQ
ncbi:acetolactate decarboxylase [Nostoc sp. FACHB-973]|nr:acetolactate decarboxylase [Nostoc sp. FACHB-973]